MAKVAVTKAKLEALADAIRQKAGLSGKKTLAELTQAVSDLDTGTDTSDATAGAAQVLAGYTAYGPDGKFSGTIESFNGWVLSPTNGNRIIEGNRYLASDLTVKAALLQDRTVTPSTSRQTIAKNDDQFYGLGTVTVEAAPLEERTVTPGETAQVITPSSGKIGMSKVTVEAVAGTLMKSAFATVAGSGSMVLTIVNAAGISSIVAMHVKCKTAYTDIANGDVAIEAVFAEGVGFACGTKYNSDGETGLKYGRVSGAAVSDGSITLTMASFTFRSELQYDVTIYGT